MSRRFKKPQRREFKMLFAGGGSSGGTAGDQLWFYITDWDCDEGWVATDENNIEFYTGCGTPPGVDDYSGDYVIEDWFELLRGLKDKELDGVKAYAIYTQSFPECEYVWQLMMVDHDGGC